MNKPQTFIFTGRSGSGKGTQLELLKKYLSEKDKDISIKTIVMGDILRSFFKEPGYVKDIARDVQMNQGKFQPDFLTNALFVNNVIDVVDEKCFLIFDGFPRTINQLNLIKELLVYLKREQPIVINIEVSKENVKGRMLARGRGDDSESAIESRLNEYDRLMLPMLEAIKTDSFFEYLNLNGEGKIEDIHNELISNIQKYL
jgi:adenylate kinase